MRDASGSVFSSFLAKKRTASGHTDPKRVMEGLAGLSVHAALNQSKQMQYILSSFATTSEVLDEIDPDGDRTPAHWAAARGHVLCLDLLLKAGADITIRDAKGLTPLELARDLGQLQCVALLLNSRPAVV